MEDIRSDVDDEGTAAADERGAKAKDESEI
jgi:hypothetical protein